MQRSGAYERDLGVNGVFGGVGVDPDSRIACPADGLVPDVVPAARIAMHGPMTGYRPRHRARRLAKHGDGTSEEVPSGRYPGELPSVRS